MVEYLLGSHDHVGELRAEVRVLRGDLHLMADVIDCMSTVHRYTSGSVNFALTDNPTDAEIDAVLDDFERVAFAGLRKDQYMFGAVLHVKQDGSRHFHFAAPRLDLHSGNALNIAPPGWETYFGPFADAWNFEKGWADPKAEERKQLIRPGKVGLHPDWKNKEDARQEITEWLQHLVEHCGVADRAGVISALETKYQITRKGRDYVSVKVPGLSQNVRLSGVLYAEKFDGEDARTLIESTKSGVRSGPQTDARRAEIARRELEAAVNRRAKYFQDRFGVGSPGARKVARRFANESQGPGAGFGASVGSAGAASGEKDSLADAMAGDRRDLHADRGDEYRGDMELVEGQAGGHRSATKTNRGAAIASTDQVADRRVLRDASGKTQLSLEEIENVGTGFPKHIGRGSEPAGAETRSSSGAPGRGSLGGSERDGAKFGLHFGHPAGSGEASSDGFGEPFGAVDGFARVAIERARATSSAGAAPRFAKVGKLREADSLNLLRAVSGIVVDQSITRDTRELLPLNAHDHLGDRRSPRFDGVPGARVDATLARPLTPWQVYVAAKKDHFAAKNLAIEGVRAGQKVLRTFISVDHKSQKDALWRQHRGAADLPARRSLLAAKLAKERLDLRDKCRAEVAATREKYPRFADFKDWRQIKKGRQTPVATMGIQDPDVQRPGAIEQPKVQRHDLRDFTGLAAGRVVHYCNAAGDRSFTDIGRQVVVHDYNDSDAILASLQLCGAKFGEGKFQVNGSIDFKRRVCQVAAASGTRLKDPTLQAQVDKIAKDIQAKRSMEIANDRDRDLADRAIAEAQHSARSTGQRVDGEGKRVGHAVTTARLAVANIGDASSRIERASREIDSAVEQLRTRQADELERFKIELSLADLAIARNYLLDEELSTARFKVLYRHGDGGRERIMVGRDEHGRDIYFDLDDLDRPPLTVVDFMLRQAGIQHLGHVRQALRPFLHSPVAGEHRPVASDRQALAHDAQLMLVYARQQAQRSVSRPREIHRPGR